MATNGRCFAFLEKALAEGVVGRDIAIKITDCSVIISLRCEFVFQCYVDVATKPCTNIRTVSHKFCMTLEGDPIIHGFRHKHRSDCLHIAILFAPDILFSTKMRDLKASRDMHHTARQLHTLFVEFQPVTNRSLLKGTCRKPSDYDRPRLQLAARHLANDWGFVADHLVEQYQAIPPPMHNNKNNTKGITAQPHRPRARLHIESHDTGARALPSFGLRLPKQKNLKGRGLTACHDIDDDADDGDGDAKYFGDLDFTSTLLPSSTTTTIPQNTPDDHMIIDQQAIQQASNESSEMFVPDPPSPLGFIHTSQLNDDNNDTVDLPLRSHENGGGVALMADDEAAMMWDFGGNIEALDRHLYNTIDDDDEEGGTPGLPLFDFDLDLETMAFFD